jgi:hypothetical protein
MRRSSSSNGEVRRKLLIGTFAIAVFAAVAAPALAHLYVWTGAPPEHERRVWFFGGRTYNTSAAAADDFVDPVNVIFMRSPNAPASLAQVESHLDDDFSHMGPARCGSNQWMIFRAQNDRASGQPARTTELVNKQMTARINFFDAPCDRQWHIRLWDDGRHDTQTNAHPSDPRWVVGSIHRENLVCGRNGCNHLVVLPWEQAEWGLIQRLEEHCSYKDWKVLPGSYGKFGSREYRSNGILSMIQMKHKPGC